MDTLPAPRQLVFAPENISLQRGVPGGLRVGLIVAGFAFMLVAALSAFLSTTNAKIALHSLHTGFLVTMGFSLGALVFVMILHATSAGWAVSARRQFENVMSLVWVGLLCLLGVILLQALSVNFSDPGKDAPYLWRWMNPEYRAGGVLYDHKRPFLNVPFFLLRQVIFAAAFLGLAGVLWGLSRGQDSDADPNRTRLAGKISCAGLAIFAFSVAFASSDWMMALDFHWFSTMFGVYYFAGAILSAIALVTLVLLVLRGTGKLAGAFTEEHLHDLGKLLFAFTVFWAYITFSQYFLIWYANIPEETTFFVKRQAEGTLWYWLSWGIPIGHFIIPFLILLPRPNRRNPLIVGAMCVWLLAFHILDLYWMVRPEAKTAGASWLDIFGVFGPILVFLGLLLGRIGAGPLIPLADPREKQALKHKNYV